MTGGAVERTNIEGFGNARTLRNDNSSRFGKWISLDFDERGRLARAGLRTYLLEKVRLVRQTEGERGFHVFYEALASRQLKTGRLRKASRCVSPGVLEASIAAIEVAPWTPAQLREQLDAAYGRLEDMSSRRGGPLARRSTPTRRPANGTNSTSWVSVWNCGAFGHRDELAADEA